MGTLRPAPAMAPLYSLGLILASLAGQALAVGICDIIGCEGQDRASWGYQTSNGPATWATNFPDFCAGDMQSPIDLDSTKAVTILGSAFQVGTLLTSWEAGSPLETDLTSRNCIGTGARTVPKVRSAR